MGPALVVLALSLSLSPTPPSPPPDIHFNEQVDVSRVLLDARILDAHGDPLVDARPADLTLTVDGEEVPVDSVQWVSDGPSLGPSPAGGRPPVDLLPAEAPRRGRRIVLLFEKDLDGSRLPGLLRMVARARELVMDLAPEDRVAVLSYDSHLHLWMDFSADGPALMRAIDRSVLFSERIPGPDVASPSLAAFFDEPAAQDAGSMEKALLVVARALQPVPGAKSVVLIGHGMMQGGIAHPWLEDEYGQAAAMLAQSRTAVFSLDVTDADHHTMDFSLQRVAAATGGFYARTHDGAAAAMARLRGALQGHHLVSFVRPPLGPGYHAVTIRLRHGGGDVLVTPGYVD